MNEVEEVNERKKAKKEGKKEAKKVVEEGKK